MSPRDIFRARILPILFAIFSVIADTFSSDRGANKDRTIRITYNDRAGKIRALETDHSDLLELKARYPYMASVEKVESLTSPKWLKMALFVAIAQFIAIFFLADGSGSVIVNLILGILLLFLFSGHTTDKAIGVIARGLQIIFKDNSRLRDLAGFAQDRNSALLGIFTILVLVLLITILSIPERFAELFTWIGQLI